MYKTIKPYNSERFWRNDSYFSWDIKLTQHELSLCIHLSPRNPHLPPRRTGGAQQRILGIEVKLLRAAIDGTVQGHSRGCNGREYEVWLGICKYLRFSMIKIACSILPQLYTHQCCSFGFLHLPKTWVVSQKIFTHHLLDYVYVVMMPGNIYWYPRN